MNIFHKVALQGLKKNRTRTLVTIIGVALSAALITAVSTFAVSLQSYMIRGAETKYGGWHVEIPDADPVFAQKQADDSRVANVASLQNIGYAELKGSQNPDKPYLFITGWNEKDFQELPIQLLSGRLPENDGEVVAPAHISANGGVKISIGDTLDLAVGNRESGGRKLTQNDPFRSGEEALEATQRKVYTVVGICQRPGIEEYVAPGYTLITTVDAAAAYDLTVFITLNNPYQVHAYANSLPDGSDCVLNDDILRFMGLSDEKMITILLYSSVGILIVLVMLGSVLLIYNSFNISLNERMRQLGILMSVGATGKQLKNSVLFEGLCIAAIGIPIGMLAGLPSIAFVLSLVSKNFANVLYINVPLSVVVSVPALLAAAAISTATIIISAYMPAKKAIGTPVLDCIRQANEVKVEAKAIKASKLAPRIGGFEGMLASKNFKRNKRRYRSVILSLTLSAVLYVSASSFGTYLNQFAKQSKVVVEDYDISFDTRDMDEGELFQLYDELKTVDGVTQSSYQALSTYSCVLETKDLSNHFLEVFGKFIGFDGESKTVTVQLDMQFVEDGVYQRLLKGLGLSEEEYNGQDKNMIMAGTLPEGWYTQEEPMEFTICNEAESKMKTIRATFVKDYPDMLPSDRGELHEYALRVIVPYERKQQFDALDATVKPPKIGLIFHSNNPGRSVSAMQAIIDADGITADYHLYNVYGILEQNRSITFIIDLFAAIFIAMISLIAVANVFNTISTNIKLRRREFAMLRSVGMSERDFNKMMRFECVLYGVRTLLWSLPISGIFSCLIYVGMTAGGDKFDFAFPWRSIGISMLGVFLVVFITTLYAIHEIKKENIIDTLRDELV